MRWTRVGIYSAANLADAEMVSPRVQSVFEGLVPSLPNRHNAIGKAATMSHILLLLSCFLAFLCAASVEAAVYEVSPSEQERWLRHLIPLPHQISVQKKTVLAPDSMTSG